MKIKRLKVKHFRSYYDEMIIELDDLTALIGKNDIGKSTILEALEFFFNEGKGVIKVDKEDLNKIAANEGLKEFTISVEFTDLPDKIVIDASHHTTFEAEYLLNAGGNLEIIKRVSSGGSSKTSILAQHPTHQVCGDLLSKKNSDCQKIIKEYNIHCDHKGVNAVMRKAIWGHFQEELVFEEKEIDISKEDAKNIAEKVFGYLPIYTLFQADRKNVDGDSEVQDPLKSAIKEILSEEIVKNSLETVASRVTERLTQIAKHTLEKLQEMNPAIADSLNPSIPPTATLKWAEVFKNLSITGDEGIPINKRGSGVKRLILLNFFRGEAERRKTLGEHRSIIYAIEEPETSQHSNHQQMMLTAFKSLSQESAVQILITTHSPVIVKGLPFSNLRLIYKETDGSKKIHRPQKTVLPHPTFGEINHIAFDENSEDYHNDLYGYLDSTGKLKTFVATQEKTRYFKEGRDKQIIEEQKSWSEYIRHQIHHPENIRNKRYTHQQLSDSIDAMRRFILDHSAD